MLDDRDAYTPGWKFAEWEMRGVPLRLEIGPKDIEKQSVLLARRDTRAKTPTPMEGLPGRVAALLDEIQAGLLDRALKFREERTCQHHQLRGVRQADGGAARVRHLAVVRVRRVRDPDQGRDAGDDPQHPVHRAQGGRARA